MVGWKCFYHSHACIIECVSIYIFNFFKKDKKKKKRKKERSKRQKKQKKLKKKNRISVKNLTRYDDIVCKFVLCTFHLLEWVVNFSGCLYEFNVVYVQREKSQYLFYYNNVWSTHFQEPKKKRHFCLLFYHLYLFIHSFK